MEKLKMTARLQRYLDQKTEANFLKLSTSEQQQLENEGEAIPMKPVKKEKQKPESPKKSD
jgi:hypothetical protein